MTNRAAENLALLDEETARLLATVDDLVRADLTRETLCQGWSVAHVLTHLARNADALLNLVRWAVDGQERPAYASEEVRAEEITVGAGRSLEAIRKDVAVSAERFRTLADALQGEAGEARVRTRTGTPLAGAQIVSLRLLEVVFHHVDLQAGYTFEDAHPAWVGRMIRRGARQWEATGAAPGLTLLPAGLEPLRVGGGGAEVHGTPGQLLLWLARGVNEDLRADVDLPTPPAWA
ncbi:maleylpyruvate isomerase family mycothiol-dependent enzyme [Ornithinimicrobium cryptoxanthini]|uniref:maleylpyruvate isomerase family mycothiol-dependent enzyme n=1 Tax=Ornithinimicrobium cryptoxanthini TaxID=2934161 RepID=UPI0021192C4C|nr:maleylpyruvate isomerase family mycothiol-dependent enzyme [Ornithinimicrobium cryptoxanthini]